MKYLIWILAVLIALILQNGILGPLHLGPVNLVLVLMVLALLFDDLATALIICISGGLMLDFLAGTSLGTMMFSLLAVLATAHVLFEIVVTRELNQWLVAAAVSGSSVIFSLYFLLFNWLFGLFGRDVAVSFSTFWLEQLWLIFFNLILTYPIYKYFLLTQYVYAKSLRNRK